MAPYLVVGGLLAALGCVSVLVLTGNQISDHKAELAEVKAEDAALEEKVQQMSAYTQFAAVRDQRTATVASLADSRFDWERVLHELSLVLPDNVWLIGVTGTVSPGVTLAQSTGVAAAVQRPGTGARDRRLRREPGRSRRLRICPARHRRSHPGRPLQVGPAGCRPERRDRRIGRRRRGVERQRRLPDACLHRPL